jgi:hypothetical protein
MHRRHPRLGVPTPAGLRGLCVPVRIRRADQEPDRDEAALRVLLAQAHGDENAYHDYRDRTMATELGFEGHMKWAEAMP